MWDEHLWFPPNDTSAVYSIWTIVASPVLFSPWIVIKDLVYFLRAVITNWVA